MFARKFPYNNMKENIPTEDADVSNKQLFLFFLSSHFCGYFC